MGTLRFLTPKVLILVFVIASKSEATGRNVVVHVPHSISMVTILRGMDM